jgi:DNA-binding Lrp family transcriptional regulator
MAAKTAEQNERLKRNEEKWSSVLMDAGWTVLPSIILEKQHALGLDPIDLNILMHLARHRWYSDNLPHPSKGSIARCMGIDPSTVRRHIAQMERDGFIKREVRYTKRKFGGQHTNKYHFDGLIKAAMPHAEEFIALREKQRSEDADRRRRKRPAPSLVVDNTDKGGRGQKPLASLLERFYRGASQPICFETTRCYALP